MTPRPDSPPVEHVRRSTTAVAVLTLFLILSVLPAPPAWSATITIQPSSGDSYLDEDRGGSSYGSNSTMFVQSRSGGRDRRSLVKFDLSAIPAGSQITGATLKLFMTAAPSATRTYNVHRVTRSWVEADVSWDEASNNVSWTTAGGDYSAGATASVTTGTVSSVWLAWDVTADVDAWYAGTANNGVLVKDSAENSTTAYSATFATRENGTAANRPQLVVTYTPPDLQVTSLTVDASVVNGDEATVTMTVQNNGPTTITDVTPSALTTSGTATKALATGPTPASVASLASGASATFTWTYTITGSNGQTYGFSGSASAAGGITANTATSNTGSIATYGVSVTPTEVTAAGTNVQVQFTITNGLTSGTVDRVTITDPNTSIWQYTSGGWGANDATGWTQSMPSSSEFRYSSPSSGQDIAAQGSKTFTVTFSLIGNPGTDTAYTFSVAIHRRNGTTNTRTVSLTVRVPSLQVQSLTVESSAVSGGTARVVMTVRNTGATALSDITPSPLAASGTATKSLASGPIPASAASLAPDASTTFEWTYTITGTVGQTYSFTGYATANGGAVTASSATSNTGSIVAYGLALTPTSVTAGATAVQVQFGITNNLTSGTVDQVTVTNPNTSIWQSNATWGNNDGTGWTRSQPAGNQYRFASPGAASDIQANGASKTFTVTFATIGDPGLDTSYTFSVQVRQRGSTTTTLTDQISVTRYVLSVKSVSPASIASDGASTSRVTVTLTRAGAPEANQTVTFTTSAGTFGGLSSTTAVTDASGDAYADVTSPVSGSTSTATVNASVASGATTSTTVTFEGVVIAVAASPASVGADGESTSTLTITLTRGGAAYSGRTVTLSTTGGTLAATSLTTNASGQATTTLTAPASGSTSTATLTAGYLAPNFAATTTVTFEGVVLALASSPASIPADGASTSSVTVTLSRGGAAVSGATVTLATSAGSLAPASVTTNGAGQASTILTSAASASDTSATVTATYRGVTGETTVMFRAVTLSISASPGSIAADGVTSSTITATVTSGGTPLAGRTVSFGTTGGSLSSASASTDAAGQATVAVTSAASKSTSSVTITGSYAGVDGTATVTFTAITVSEVLELRVVSGNGTNTAHVTPDPSAQYYAGAVLLRRTGAAPQVPTDGVALALGNTLADGSVVVANGATIAVADNGLTNGVKYYYRAFGYYAGTLYSTAGALVDAIPSAGGAGQAQWSVNSSTAGLSEPVVDGAGSVFWNGTAGGIVATDAATGAELWPPALAGSVVDGSVVLTDIQGLAGTYAVVGTRNGTVAAVNAATGAPAWESVPLGDAISANVAMQVWAASDSSFQSSFTGDLLIVGTKNANPTTNKVYGIDAATGNVVWTWNPGGVDRVTGWPWVDHATNRVIVTTRSNGNTQPSLWVLSTLNGNLVKSWSLGDIDAWLTYGMDYVAYVPAADGNLYALDLATWTMKWTAPFSAGSAIVGSVWEDWNLRGTLFFSTQDGHVWAVESSGGSATPTQVWSTPVPGASAPLVFVDPGLLYVGGSDGKLHELRIADGVDQKQALLGDGTAAGGLPAWDYVSGWLYTPTAAGKVFAIPSPLP